MRSGRMVKLGGRWSRWDIFMSVYAVCVILSGYLDEYEKGIVRDKSPFPAEAVLEYMRTKFLLVNAINAAKPIEANYPP